jgi:acyl-CoA synthetase (AMP-forming)/AMP-acid ligase II
MGHVTDMASIVATTEYRALSMGELWTAGPGVGIGYYRREESTAATFGAHTACEFRGRLSDGRWLRTGDLGVLIAPTDASGGAAEIFITGRLKDVIIIAGGNYYPQDMEVWTQ